MLSVQSTESPKWPDKINKALWRGRDSREERLNLVIMARKKPELYDAALTNFFFFEYDEKKYGPKAKHISFFDFFKVSTPIAAELLHKSRLWWFLTQKSSLVNLIFLSNCHLELLLKISSMIAFIIAPFLLLQLSYRLTEFLAKSVRFNRLARGTGVGWVGGCNESWHCIFL